MKAGELENLKKLQNIFELECLRVAKALKRLKGYTIYDEDNIYKISGIFNEDVIYYDSLCLEEYEPSINGNGYITLTYYKTFRGNNESIYLGFNDTLLLLSDEELYEHVEWLKEQWTKKEIERNKKIEEKELKELQEREAKEFATYLRLKEKYAYLEK